MRKPQSGFGWPLATAGWALVAAAGIHVAALIAGPRWMVALGAPPPVVASLAEGTLLAPVSTIAIAGVLTLLAACCFSAAGRVRRVPLATPLLALFAVVLLARGLLVVPFLMWGQRAWGTPFGRVEVAGDFFVVESLAVLAIGTLIAIGLVQRGRAGT